MPSQGVMPGRSETGGHLALGFQKRLHHAQNSSGFREVLKRIQGDDDVGAFLRALREVANVVYARVSSFLPGHSQNVFADVDTNHPFSPMLRQLNCRGTLTAPKIDYGFAGDAPQESIAQALRYLACGGTRLSTLPAAAREALE